VGVVVDAASVVVVAVVEVTVTVAETGEVVPPAPAQVSE
jgi:hypothetical protein